MTSLRISLFSGFSAVCSGVNLPTLSSRRAVDLLTYLLLSPPIAHQRRTLAALFWPDLPEARAAASLRQVIFRVQSWLAAVPDAETLLDARRQTVAIRLSGFTVDVLELERIWQAVQLHRHRSLESCSVCLAQLEQALAGVHPAATLHQHHNADEPYQDWLFQRLTAVLPLLTSAYALLTAHYLRRDQPLSAVQTARRWLTVDPWHEDAHRTLMTALALDQRRAEALTHFQQLRRRMRRDLGFDSDPETQRLAERIAYEPAATLRPTVFRSLPPIPQLIGRDRELQLISELLADPTTRLIALVGIGGVGKTVLAAAVGQRCLASFRDGAVMVPLIGCRTQLDAAQAIADLLSLTFRDSRPLAEQLGEQLAAFEVLLILDNTDQIDGIADLVNVLIRDCPRLVLLVTSREPIGHLRERLILLDGLSYRSADEPPHAVPSTAAALVIDLLQQVAPERQVADQLPLIERICRLLAGHPLALTLVALRARFQPLETVEAQLLQEPVGLAADLAGLAPRHQHLRLLIDESLQSAGADVRTALSAAGWFVSGFDAAAAQAVAEIEPPQWQRLIERAIAFGLVRSDGLRRYTLHPLIRAALTIPRQTDAEIPVSLVRYVEYYLCLFCDSGIRYVNRAAVAWTQQYGAALDDLLNACSYAADIGRFEQLRQVILPLLAATVIRGRQQQTMQALIQIAASLPVQQAAAAADCAVRLHAACAWLAVTVFHIEPTLTAAAAALAMPLHDGQQADRLWARRARAGALIAVGRLDEAADDLLVEPLAPSAEQAPIALGDPLAARGRLALWRGEFDAAAELLQQALLQRRMLGDTRGELACLNDLAHTAARRGEYVASLRALQAAAAVARDLGDDSVLSVVLTNLSLLRLDNQIDDAAAEHDLNEALALKRRIGSRAMIRSPLSGMQQLMLRRRRYDLAVRYGREYLTIELALGVRRAGLSEGMRLVEGLIGLGRRSEAAALAGLLAAHPLADAELTTDLQALLADLPPPDHQLVTQDPVAVELRLSELLARLNASQLLPFT
jgi:DNA-binding SARP family transcriptional activator/predicted ATPase